MRVLLFFVFLAVSACADQQLKPLPAGNGSESHATDSHGTDTAAGSGDQQLKPLPAGSGTDSHATDSHGTAAGSTPKPSGSEGQDHQHQQEQPVTVRPHVGGMGGLPRPPHRQPGLHFPGLNPGFGQGFVPGFGQGFFPGFNPGPLPGFMPQLPFPGFGR